MEMYACVTTRICVEMNNLHIVKDFGEVQMGWNVFRKTIIIERG